MAPVFFEVSISSFPSAAITSRPVGIVRSGRALSNEIESNTIFEDLPLYKLPSYGLVNASVGLHGRDDRWSVTLWSRNLADEYYWTAVASNANVVVRFPSPPRTYGATFGFKF